MNLPIESLEALQNLDLKIESLRNAYDGGPVEQKKLTEQIAAKEAELKKDQDRLDKLTLNLKDKDVAYETETAQMKKMQDRVASITNQKEYQANMREIESTRMELSILEEDRQTASERVAKQKSIVSEKTEEFEAYRAERQERINTLTNEIGSLDENLASLENDRKTLVNNLGRDAILVYERVRRRKKGKILHAVSEGSCASCHIAILPQRFNELQKQEELLLCDCSALLYYQEAEPSV